MKSIFNGHGYTFNDDRASGGKLTEDDIIACSHHGGALKKSDWKLKGGMCMVCAKPLCFRCYDRARTFGCEGPDEKRIEKIVNDTYRIEQNAKVLGI